MNFGYTEEQNEYRSEIIKFANKNLNNHDYTKFNQDLWKKIADFGFLAFNVGEQYGGLEESYLTTAICLEALGYACEDNGFIFVINNHLWVAQNLISIYGTDVIKDKYLKKMVSGDCIGCFALTEAEAGSDALSMTTVAEEVEDGFILNGNKIFISNAPIADLFVVIAKTKKDKYTAFVVEKEFEGVSIGKTIEKMGLESCPFSEVIFDHCKVPKENIIGNIDGGSFIMAAALEWERCFEFASHIGTMQRIMEQCISYARKRKQFKKPIAEFQGVSNKIADMKVAIEMSRCMLHRIALLKDNDMSAFKESAIFKLYVSENYVQVCQNAIQIFGGYGYSKEYGFERELRDAMGSVIYSGTSEIQRDTIFKMSLYERF